MQEEDVESMMNEKIVRNDKMRKVKSPQQRQQAKTAVVVVLLVVAIAAAGYYFLIPKEKTYTLSEYTTGTIKKGDLIQTTQASGTVNVAANVVIGSPEEGYAKKLYVEAGDSVKKGQILAAIEVPDLEDELESDEANLEVLEYELKSSQEQTVYSLKKLRKSLSDLDEDIIEAEKDVAKAEALVKINGARQSDLETAQTALRSLLREKKDTELEIEELEGLAKITQESKEASIIKAKLEIEHLKKQIANANITSPMDGDVIEVEDSLGVAGSLITEGQELFTVADRGSVLVDLAVSENYASVLQIGQRVALTIGTRSISGSIVSIGKVAEASSDGIGSTVTVRVNPASEGNQLLPGSSAVGEIEVGTLPGVLYLPRGPYLTTGSQKYLYVVDDTGAKKTSVSFGTVQGENVVVLKGVSEGTKVITSGYQNFIDYDSVILGKE
jgi:HlyD family secretion protein